jgi:hypothetical protein
MTESQRENRSSMNRVSPEYFASLVLMQVCWLLLPSFAYAQADERTKLCEVRPGCSVLVREDGKCTPRTVEGGTCPGGLLQGAVVNRFSSSSRVVVRYFSGKGVGYSLRLYGSGGREESGALNFMLTEVDALGHPLPMRNEAFNCTITPDAEMENFPPESMFYRVCMEAIAWLGTETVKAAFKESGPVQASVPSQPNNASPARSNVADAQPISTTRLADDAKVTGGSGFGN